MDFCSTPSAVVIADQYPANSLGEIQAVCAGRHNETGEEHPHQASAVATHWGETAWAAVQFFPSPTVMAPAPVSAEACSRLVPGENRVRCKSSGSACW